jgi:tRNA threonylcarbamoyladenosine biosynthesis protein TsaB
MIDARRMEVYAMLINSEGRIIHDVEARIIDRYSYQDYLQKNRVVFFGDGAAKCKESINHPNALFAENIHSSAKALGELACEKYARSEFEDLVHFEPFYLKEFVAKRPTRSLL